MSHTYVNARAFCIIRQRSHTLQPRPLPTMPCYQTFKNQVALHQLDPTDGGNCCDFCSWQLMTAQDKGFGRIELRHAVTASNLFKCCGGLPSDCCSLAIESMSTTPNERDPCCVSSSASHIIWKSDATHLVSPTPSHIRGSNCCMAHLQLLCPLQVLLPEHVTFTSPSRHLGVRAPSRKIVVSHLR